MAPRETATLQLAATDVPSAYQALRDAVAKTTGRVLGAQLNEQDRQNITAQFDFEVRRADEGVVRAALGAAGDVVSRQVARVPESDSVTDAKVLYRVALAPAGRLAPRRRRRCPSRSRTWTVRPRCSRPRWPKRRGGRWTRNSTGTRRGGRRRGSYSRSRWRRPPGLVERLKGAGTVRASQSVRDPQATEGRFATARLHVTLTNAEAIVPDGTGVWPKVREGLSISASVLLTSVTWVVFGLCVVLPWALIGVGGYRLVRRFSGLC
ncbi:: DUF4349 [Gemmata massiliana]|uniref:: DUF4349 n=1 Tax=Gemmata massiliana TaxID=1210884 RepID=A0A6P2D204_9BACT|nr:hypothetical protein [Gemmata massiliana]VTR95159.1 : DUF4349 [Gemmata massiliana]